jgi:RimJ/RimL family protein N-acetyltransferase
MEERATILTERLILRPFVTADAREVQLLAGDRAVADTVLGIPHPYGDGEAEKWISTHQAGYEEGRLANFAIVLRDGGGLVGAVGLVIDQRFDSAELGYWIGRPHWSRGYCTEACRAAIGYGFNGLRLNRIHASYFLRNPASGRVMEKLGMTREGLRRQHVKKWGRYEDVIEYGLLRCDWIASGGRPSGDGADTRSRQDSPAGS